MELNVHKLKVIMCDRKETICSLSSKIGVHRSTTSGWLNGRVERLSLPLIHKIIEALEMSTEEAVEVFLKK